MKLERYADERHDRCGVKESLADLMVDSVAGGGHGEAVREVLISP
jgi:hypothetical protein